MSSRMLKSYLKKQKNKAQFSEKEKIFLNLLLENICAEVEELIAKQRISYDYESSEDLVKAKIHTNNRENYANFSFCSCRTIVLEIIFCIEFVEV